MIERPQISIIIPAYNEERFIADAILSVKQQTPEPLETIVVANSCTDRTAEIARDYGAKVIETPVQGISYAKNLGAREARGDVLAFMDADCKMQEGLTEAVVRTVLKGYDGGKAKIVIYDDTSLKAKAIDLFRDVTSRALERVQNLDYSGTGAFTFATRELFKKIENFYGEGWNTNKKVLEDIDFHMRIKKHGRYKYLTEACALTSARRFLEEGYLSCYVEDAIHGVLPWKDNIRGRWQKKTEVSS